MSCSDDFVEDNNEEVCMSSSEYWYVHRDGRCIRFVQPDTKVALTAVKKIANKRTSIAIAYVL